MMNVFQNSAKGTAVRSLAVLSLLLAGCAGQKSFWGDPSTGLVLRYRAPEKAAVLRYVTTAHSVQNMTFGDQPMEIKTDQRTVATLAVSAGDPIPMRATLDTVSVKTSSPMGDMNPDMSALTGKPFGLTLSALGKETLGADAAGVTVDLGQMGGKRGVSAEFADFFDNLPAGPVRIGDSWTLLDTLNIEQGPMKMVLVTESRSTLAGLETVAGLECAMITVESKGTISGAGEQMGAPLTITGKIQGGTSFAFAYKKGILVRSTGESRTESVINMSGPEDMTIPMTTTSKTEKTLR
jgi:hypothetical protein